MKTIIGVLLMVLFLRVLLFLFILFFLILSKSSNSCDNDVIICKGYIIFANTLNL